MRSGSQKLPPKYIPLSFPEVRAYIRPILREDGSVNITADLQYADGGKHDWDIRCTRSAKSVAEIDIVAPQMAAELAQRYAKRLREISVTTNCEKPYSTAFHALDDIQRRGLVPHTRQSEKYIQQSLSDFSIILNILDRYGLDLNDADLDAIVAARRKLAESSKNAIKDPETTTTTVNKALKNFNVLYPMLRAAQPDFHLPELHLPLLLGGRGAKREQVKVLPDDMLLMFAALLWRLIGYGLTLGAVLMLTGMARTAEACAPKFKHFIIYDDYAVFGVFYQSNNAIVPIDILKTRSAYRLVILPKYARNLIVATMEHLKAEGFAESDIMELPAVSSPNKPQTMAAPSELSDFVRELLTLLGCDKGFWNSVSQMVEREPDLDGFGKINKDPSAYILRRNGCTQYVNRCGMPPNLVDVLMGHEIVKSDPTDWIARVRRPDTWPEIAAAEEHWVLDPEHSAHPCFRAVGLQASTDTELPLYSEASFEVEEDGAYVFAFDAPEANDAVAISLSCAGAAVDLPVISLSNEEHPPIIGSVPSPTFFEIAHRKAAKLDIHTIIPEESDDHEEE